MEEISEKETAVKPQVKKKKVAVSMYLTGIPMSAHEKLKLWNLKMSVKLGRRVKLTQTYVEAIKEFSKTL